MSEYHFPVPGSPDEGQIILFFRKHWAAFAGQTLLIIFLFIFPAVLFVSLYFATPGFFHGIVLNFTVLGLSTYYLVILTFAYTAWVTFYYNIYIITNSAIIDVNQQGLFGRRISQLPLDEVQDVSSNIKGYFPTLFGYGDILVETASESVTNFLITQVYNPQEISSKIMELQSQYNLEKNGKRIVDAHIVSPSGVKEELDEELKEEQNRPVVLEEKREIAGQLGLSVAEEETVSPEETALSEPVPEETAEPTIIVEKETAPQEKTTSPHKPPAECDKEGEVSSNDLNQGGSIDLGCK